MVSNSKNGGRSKKTQGRTAGLKNGDSNLAVGSYLQRGSASSPPPPYPRETRSPGRCQHDNALTNKIGRVWALSTHYITRIGPQQALPLARICCQVFILKYIPKLQGTRVAPSDSHSEKGNVPYVLFFILTQIPQCPAMPLPAMSHLD